MKQIRFTVTVGEPSKEELAALEQALRMHERPAEESATKKSTWGKPILRRPLKQNL